MIPSEVPKLYSSPENQRFSEKGPLEQRLMELDEKTFVRPPASPDEITLDSSGRTELGGYRYAAVAFDTVSRILAPGLSTLIPNIAGMNVRSGRIHEEISFAEAIEIFNMIVRLRFYADLSTHQLVINEKDNYIEGLLGPKTRYLENSTLLQIVDDMLSSVTDRNIQFHSAQLAGRRLLLRYRNVEPVTSIGPCNGQSHEVHRGYHFSNSESGDASIRAAPMYLCLPTEAVSLGKFAKTKTRMLHTGKDFRSRLNRLLASVIDLGVDPDTVSRKLLLLRERTLDLDPLDVVNFESQVSDLVDQVSRYGTLTESLAQKIVDNAVYTGAFPVDDAEYRMVRNKQIAGRTSYDVYHAIGMEARKLPIRHQETAEQSAFEYLMAAAK